MIFYTLRLSSLENKVPAGNLYFWYQHFGSYVMNSYMTQDQFDALVSFVYNRGQTNSEAILIDINQHNFVKAVRAISVLVYGRNKLTGKEVFMPGLVARRAYETGPFQ